MKASFISWVPHCSRSDAIAASLGGISHLIHYLGFKKPWHAIVKYPLQAVDTLIRLSKDKPDLVLVATPPIIAAIPVYLYARVRNLPFVIDAHTGVFDDPRWAWSMPLSRWLSRAATATIVTNDHLAQLVSSWGARAVIIGTLPVAFPAGQHGGVQRPKVMVINTFSRDEPVDEVLNAAKNLPHVVFDITGDIRTRITAFVEGCAAKCSFYWLAIGRGLRQSSPSCNFCDGFDHPRPYNAARCL